MNTVINIGIDVHNDFYSLCSYSFATKQAFDRLRSVPGLGEGWHRMRNHGAHHTSEGIREPVKNFTRHRNTCLQSLKKLKQNPLSFLLRCGRVFSVGSEYWTKIHNT